MALMMVAFAVWLAFRIMRHVEFFYRRISGRSVDRSDEKVFLCFICGMLATSTTGVIWVLNSLIFPIYNAFLELGSEMLGYFAREPGRRQCHRNRQLQHRRNGIVHTFRRNG